MIYDFLWPELERIVVENFFPIKRVTKATKISFFHWRSFRTVISVQEVLAIGHLYLVILRLANFILDPCEV